MGLQWGYLCCGERENTTMPKINIYLPDELADAIRDTGLPVSAICQRALEQAVRRVTAIRETTVHDLTDDDLATRLPRFTARTRTALRLAIDQAATTDTAVSTADLLTGLLTEGNNLALHILHAMEVDPTPLAHDLDRHTPNEPGGQPGRFTTPATNALELAVTEATALGHNYVGTEHLLLGLTAEPDGAAGQLLRARGLELRLTRRTVTGALAGYMHLNAQTQTDTTTGPTALTELVRAELRPLIERLERLEQHIGPTDAH
ncbi:Clp protease N-terminal domain-containing protein [Micromonospora sp. CPCC 206060]|uniref:Clp protease N-terminal domain-containing protein n=1 Tax=Micromonospora sp. CPCC 206060 TaxID=3122406 RepID=UPI002FF2545A